jgi:hypothetical protein
MIYLTFDQREMAVEIRCIEVINGTTRIHRGKLRPSEFRSVNSGNSVKIPWIYCGSEEFWKAKTFRIQNSMDSKFATPWIQNLQFRVCSLREK